MSQLPLLGEIVTWQSPESVSFATLQQSLDACGLGAGLARDMLPRNAFGRAIKHLKEERVIEQTDENEDYIWFQFTKRHWEANLKQFDYKFELRLKLHKLSGVVVCENTALAAEAYTLIQNEMGRRVSSDVTRIVQSVFQKQAKHGGLFPIRPQGGAYFVPEQYRFLVDQFSKLFSGIGGQLIRWEIPSSPENTKSVGAVVCEAVDKLIEDYKVAVDEYDPKTTSADDLAKTSLRIVEVQDMMSQYGNVLGGLATTLKQKLDEYSKLLTDKITGRQVVA